MNKKINNKHYIGDTVKNIMWWDELIIIAICIYKTHFRYLCMNAKWDTTYYEEYQVQWNENKNSIGFNAK